MNSLNLFFFLLVLSFYVVQVTHASNNIEMGIINNNNSSKKSNPFTAKASLIRYWNSKISNGFPPPSFLLSKASPVGPTESAVLSKLASDPDSLPTHLDSFCSLAGLLCSFDPPNDNVVSSNGVVSGEDANFALYSNRRFANYGDSRLGGVDSFKNYSAELNSPTDSFRRYSRASASRAESFAAYATDSNVAATNFTSYGAAATGGSGEFKTYHDRVNVPNLRFSSYDSDANGHRLGFASYASETNSGSESFLSYSKNGNGSPAGFESYAEGSNAVGSGFTVYGAFGNGGNDSFKAYGLSGNDPKSDFRSYGAGGNSGSDGFSTYRAGSNVGSDSFQSYARNSNSGRVVFSNYGKSFNLGSDSFKEYAKGSLPGRASVRFKSYSLGRSFKDYAKTGIVFEEYDNFTTAEKGSFVIGGRVEAGKFFRERVLKEGNVMIMPDIRDKMPKRPFLPRFLSGKIPFNEAKRAFRVRDGSVTELVINDAVKECGRAPSPGEKKRCVGSAEGMIDFAVSVLGRDVAVRTTDNVNGSGGKVMIGRVGAINGGNATESVSCHQTLYPYLLYYCHSVPKVRVYEADILDMKSKEKINHGVAICHLDTSSWAQGHGAFVALGSGPGKIEVCHWIFENDMSWAVADH